MYEKHFGDGNVSVFEWSAGKMTPDYKLLHLTLGLFHDLFCLCVSLFTFLLVFSAEFLSFSIHIHLQSFYDTAYMTSQLQHFSGRLIILPLHVVQVKVSWPKPWWQMLCNTICPQGDSLRTSIQLDFGDGIKITYSNLSRADDGIKHIYRTTGIYRVTATAENSQGSDSSTLFLHITSMWIRNIITDSWGCADSINLFSFMDSHVPAELHFSHGFTTFMHFNLGKCKSTHLKLNVHQLRSQ